MADEVVTIIITGNSTEGVAAAERQAAAIGGIGVAAKKATAESMTMATRLKSTGTSVAAIGRGISKGLTVPILAVGTASVLLSRDFGGAMRLISTQAGASAKEMEHMKAAVLDMVADGRVKQTPKELAEALFHIESVGYRGTKALHTLKSASDLAVVGQSNLETTTYALVSAMETGIDGTENLHNAIGTLNAIVGTGDMKMEDLTQALSSGVLASANQVGLSLRDVGAALDTMTARGMPANVAASRLRMTFTLMAAPTEKAKKALKGIGLDQEAMAKQMQGPKGLIGALELLKDHMSGLTKIEQTQLLSEAFGGARSGTTMMALIQNLDDVQERFEHIGKTTGDFSKKLKEVKESAGFKMDVAWSQLQATLIKLGDDILPIIVPAFQEFGEALGDVSDWFTSLPDGTQALIVKLGLAAAALGPLVLLTGKLIKAGGMMVGWTTKAAGGLAGMVSGTVANTEANAALTTSYIDLTAAINGAAVAQERFVATKSGLLVPPGAIPPTRGQTLRQGAGKYLNRAGTGLMIGTGGLLAGEMIGGRGGGVVSDMGVGAGVGMMAGPWGAAAGAAIGAMAGAITEAGEGMGGKLAESLAEGFDKELRPKLDEALKHKDLGDLGGIRRNLRKRIGLAISAGASDADLKPLRERLNAVSNEMARIQMPRDMLKGGMESLRSGIVVRMQDIRKVFDENVREIGMGWKHGSDGWRKATAQNLQATVHAIRAGIRKGVIDTDKGTQQIKHLLGEMHLVKGDDPLKLAKGFRDSWKKAHAINDAGIDRMKHKLAQMPKDSREAAQNAMVGMAKALEHDGKLPKGSVDRLRSALVTRFGQTNKEINTSLSKGVQGMGTILSHLGGFAKDSYGKLQKIAGQEISHAISAQGKLKTSAQSDLPKVTESYKDFGKESGEALTLLGGQFNAFLTAFKQKPIDFTVSASNGKAQGKAEGGFFVPGSDRRDHVHAILGAQEAVVNVHQQPEVQMGLAISKAMGYGRHGSLQELFAGITTPNHFAGGGFASKVPRETLHPASALTPAGQKGLDMARHAGLEYVAKHAGGDRSIQALIRNANAIDAQRFPYKWGGGHQSTPAPWLVPYDCSGVTSALVQHSGWSDIPTMVSSGFESVGKPGRGKFSILANNEHVYSVIAGRAFGTSEENPGGGAGWISGYTYRPGFTVRHLPVLGEAQVGEAKPSGHKGGGQKQAKGFARGGFLGGKMVQRLAKGGFATPQMVGASYYGGPTDSTSGTVGAAGVSLVGTKSFAELDMGKALGGLAMHTKLKIGYKGKSVIAEKLDIGAGGGPVNGKHRSIDLWHETAEAIGMPGLAVVSLSDPSGGGKHDKGSLPAEVPAKVFHGTTHAGGGTSVKLKQEKLSTDRLDSFGSLPDDIPKCRKEIEQRRRELARYRAGYREYRKSHPDIADAFKANITLLLARLSALRKQLNRLLRQRHIKKLTSKIAKAAEFAYWNDEQSGILPRAQEMYEKAAEYADQVVALEPEEPANFTGDFSKVIKDYIENQEGPAYSKLLDVEGDWRNKILSAEEQGTAKMGAWREQITQLHTHIEQIKALKGNPKTRDAWLKQRGKIPVMQAQMKALRSSIKVTQDEVMPSWEDMLVGVQGRGHSHEKVAPLPVIPQAGSYGGYIFDTQMAIQGLGVKVSQASSGGAGGTSDALAEAIAEQNRIAARKQGIETNLGGVLAGFREEFGRRLPYVGAFADGGIVPGPMGAPGLAVVHGGERITPVGGGGDTHIYLAGDLAKLVEASAPGMAKKSDEWIGRNFRRLSFAPGG